VGLPYPDSTVCHIILVDRLQSALYDPCKFLTHGLNISIHYDLGPRQECKGSPQQDRLWWQLDTYDIRKFLYHRRKSISNTIILDGGVPFLLVIQVQR